MSQPTGKDLKGLMEAYASIYKQEEVVVEQEIHQEQFEINEEVLYESMIVYLVEFGYASTEKQAVNMIPHLSERWSTNIAVEIIITETFFDGVNLLVDEGYDLSSHTWEELYEQYVENLNNILIQEGVENLHEALPLLIPAGAAMAPFAKAALLGGALYAGKKAYDAYQDLRGRTSPEGERFLNAPLPTTKPKVKPTTVVKSQSGDVNLDNPSDPSGSATSPELKQTNVSSPATSGGGSGGGGKPPNGKPPKDGKPPKIGPLTTLRSLFKEKGLVSQVLGKPAQERFFGTTRAGQVTRGLATTGVSALDTAGTLTDPTGQTKSRVAQLGSLGPGFVGTISQGLGYATGGARPTGGGLEKGLVQLGNRLRQVGREMRDQGTPPPPPTPPPSGSQGMTPMFRGNKIVGYK